MSKRKPFQELSKSEQEALIKKAIIKDPFQEIEYNFLPLFHYLKAAEKSLEEVSKEMENHCDNLIQIIPPGDAYAVKETKDIHHFLVELKQLLRKIEVVH